MTDEDRKSGGARLPLALLLGFLALVGGVVLWLDLTAPPESAGKHAARVDPGTDAVPGKPAPPATATPPAGAAPAPPAPGQPAPGQAAPHAATEHAAPAHPAPEHAAPAAASPAPAHSQPHSPAPAPPAHAPAPDAAQRSSAPEAAHGSGAPGTAPGNSAPEAAHGSGAPAPGTAARPPGNGDQAARTTPAERTAPPPAVRPVMPAPLPPVRPDPPLPPAPDPGLVQESPLGPLPRVGADGRVPWKVYAKPFDPGDKRPRVAIVVSGLGLSAAATESAIQGLPGGVTLAFAPYSNALDGWIRLARAAGHEVLINVPMEPVNYPAYDPGPQTLLTSLNTEGNMDRLLWILSRGTGYVGVIDFMGSRFTASRPHMAPVLEALRERGLMFVDSGSAARGVSEAISREIGMPSAVATLTLDDHASRIEIDRKFSELERIARRDRRAVGVASSYPVTLERIATWARQLEARGIAVAPVSALAGLGKQEARQ